MQKFLDRTLPVEKIREPLRSKLSKLYDSAATENMMLATMINALYCSLLDMNVKDRAECLSEPLEMMLEFEPGDFRKVQFNGEWDRAIKSSFAD